MPNPPDPGDVQDVLLAILDEAIQVGGARCGNVQVVNANLNGLEIAAQRGFEKPFLDLFRLVRRDDASACARAWRLQHRVSIPSVADDPAFAPYVAMAHRAGFEAVQSTPILTAHGVPIGVLSTHFPRRQVPSLAESVLLDHYARRAARAISNFVSGESGFRSPLPD